MSKVFLRFPKAGMPGDMNETLGPALRSMRSRPARAETGVVVADLDDVHIAQLRDRNVEVFADLQFQWLQRESPEVPPGPQYWTKRAPALAPALGEVGLDAVLTQIRAREAWSMTRGAGVTVAVVDTGICGTMREYPASQRSAVNPASLYGGQHWTDEKGHGSMCASIAAGTKKAGGRFDGVAPDATLLAARTDFAATDIYTIYAALIDAKRSGSIPGPLVISNSYGMYMCAPDPAMPEDHPFLEVVLEAIDAGIVVVYAAGNNHVDVCAHDPARCTPNSIWAVNSHDRVISVGTVNANHSNRDASTPHVNSSRGPGQWARSLPKPDCVAPTYGPVMWGCDYRDMDWWGTSGACPQVAGLAALILSVNGALSPAQVGDIIRDSCRDLGAPASCVGHGLIDCEAAVRAALSA